MKKKIIATTIVAAICAATFSVAGCSNDKAPGAMSEDEWKAAWQATYEITNFTIKGEIGFSSTPILVSKTDFVNSIYQLPEIAVKVPVVTKQDTSLHRLYVEAAAIGENNPLEYQYFFIEKNEHYQGIKSKDGNWSVIPTDGEYQNRMSLQSTLDDLEYTLGGISLTESYSLFTYNNQTDAYESTFTLNQNDRNSIVDVKINFKKGKLSKFTLDCVISSEIDAETLSVSHRAFNYTISDIGKTVPITHEEMQMLKALITE